MRSRLAEWLFLLSAVLHFALYPLSLAAIVYLFWKLSFWHGLWGMLAIILLAVVLKMVIVGGFSMVITRLDPQFFS